MSIHKFIAIGDIHTDYDLLWAALKAASCVDNAGNPTAPVMQGRFQVVLIGDLVHPKNIRDYERMVGHTFDLSNPEDLYMAAREQIHQLDKIRRFQSLAPRSVHIILGNHDDNILNHRFTLGTQGGLTHIEFDETRGGLALPKQMREWFGGFLRELRVGQVQFAHVGPLPGLFFYDDLFYADRTHKTWWEQTPEYVDMAGLRYGVYGHTQMARGIMLNDEQRFAMIDALSHREYLELMLETQPAPEADAVLSVRSVPF